MPTLLFSYVATSRNTWDYPLLVFLLLLWFYFFHFFHSHLTIFSLMNFTSVAELVDWDGTSSYLPKSLIPSGFIPTCLIVLLWLLLLHMKFVSLCARTIWAHLEFGWIRVCEIFVFAPAWTPVLICYCTYKRVILSVHLHMSTEYALITLSMDAYKPPCVQQ